MVHSATFLPDGRQKSSVHCAGNTAARPAASGDTWAGHVRVARHWSFSAGLVCLGRERVAPLWGLKLVHELKIRAAGHSGRVWGFWRGNVGS